MSENIPMQNLFWYLTEQQQQVAQVPNIPTTAPPKANTTNIIQYQDGILDPKSEDVWLFGLFEVVGLAGLAGLVSTGSVINRNINLQ